MICFNCKKEISQESKFCPDCGKKLENASTDLDSLIEDCSRVWFIFGFMKGCEREKGKLTDIEKIIKKKYPEIWEKYRKIVQYWKDLINQNNEKKNGSERTCISEIEDIKT